MRCPCRVLRSMVAACMILAAGSARAAEPALVEAAKKEGEVIWYTTQIISQLVRPVSAAFEKKYGIKVRSTRANSTELSVKIINESRAGRPQSDVFDGTSTVVPLKKEGFVLQWQPDPAKSYPAQYKDPEGYWVANNLFFLTPGFNTALVPKGTEPRSYQALLDPKWRSKIAWSTAPSSSGGPGLIGTVLTEMGTESGMLYLRELSKQRIANIGSAAREVLDQVIAGEYPLALMIFNHHAHISKIAGAPSEWQPLEPVPATISTVGLAKNSPHPHAAMLLLDFLLSRAGQKVFQSVNYLPAHPAMPALQADLKVGSGRFQKASYINPDLQFEKNNEWVDYFHSQFLK